MLIWTKGDMVAVNYIPAALFAFIDVNNTAPENKLFRRCSPVKLFIVEDGADNRVNIIAGLALKSFLNASIAGHNIKFNFLALSVF